MVIYKILTKITIKIYVSMFVPIQKSSCFRLSISSSIHPLEALTAALEGAAVLHARRMRRVAKTVAWITVLPSTVNGTELGAQEWRDAHFPRYGLEPPDLPKYCDRCQARFSISHALDCKKCGLFTVHHNELRDGVAGLAGKAFTPSHVCDNPSIYSGRAVRRTKPTSAGSTKPNPPQ